MFFDGSGRNGLSGPGVIGWSGAVGQPGEVGPCGVKVGKAAVFYNT